MIDFAVDVVRVAVVAADTECVNWPTFFDIGHDVVDASIVKKTIGGC